MVCGVTSGCAVTSGVWGVTSGRAGTSGSLGATSGCAVTSGSLGEWSRAPVTSYLYTIIHDVTCLRNSPFPHFRWTFRDSYMKYHLIFWTFYDVMKCWLLIGRELSRDLNTRGVWEQLPVAQSLPGVWENGHVHL